VANRQASFQRYPFPDETLHDVPNETLHDGAQARQLAGLRARLDNCARSYRTGLGRVGRPTHQSLADAVDGVRQHLRPGCAPLTTYLLVWLRFAALLTHAAETPLGH
jgi:hypothetical protein